MTDRRNYRDLPDEEIVALCKNGDRGGWNEFFRRFIPLIKRAIKDRLFNSGNPHFASDPDRIEEVFEAVVTKLYKGPGLQNKKAESPLRLWLRKVADNETISWLRASGRDKNLPATQGDHFSESLSEDEYSDMAVSSDSLTALIESSELQEIRQTIEEALSDVSSTQTEKVKWVFRLSLLHYLPLTVEEVNQLARFNSWRSVDVKDALNRIEKDLSKKEEENTLLRGRVVVLWHKIRKMEAKLAEEKKSSAVNLREIQQATEDIEKIDKRQKEYIRKGETPIRPTNHDVADLVGIPADQADQISNIIIRARKALQRLSEARSGNAMDDGAELYEPESNASDDAMSSFSNNVVIKDKVYRGA
jgi:DNA-directed RNA polymerase specialized sigma24 family protein